jgi:hypothetical protein
MLLKIRNVSIAGANSEISHHFDPRIPATHPVMNAPAIIKAAAFIV